MKLCGVLQGYEQSLILADTSRAWWTCDVTGTMLTSTPAQSNDE